MNLVPQVETAELSDADLDQVSGGHVGLNAGAAVIAADGAVGAGLYVESGPFAVSAGFGASAGLGSAETHTTRV
ncbi:hypothetical protein [Streptomyces sp. AC512_CC834]|uniref:hypothetical protein n=1 Tax=Streptomyces sp. AC512_CC834 TaxID=2823691 RepID=UPI001C269E9D|nr:hypothetical protein [Streptomyces sp. AC512_CC834]